MSVHVYIHICNRHMLVERVGESKMGKDVRKHVNMQGDGFLLVELDIVPKDKGYPFQMGTSGDTLKCVGM